MKINPAIKSTLKQVSEESIKQANEPNGNYRYLRRLLNVFHKHLNEQEQIYVLSTIMEFIHYKNITTDPDNMMLLHNVRLRTYMFIALLTFLVMAGGAMLFKTNESLNSIVEMFGSLIKILSV